MAPGPRGPSILRVFRARRDPLGFLLSTARKYGGVVRLRIGRRVGYLVSDPEAVRFLLVERPDNFRKSSVLPGTGRLLGAALFSAEGADHARKRKAINPAFSHARVGAAIDIAASLAAELSARWGDGGEIDVHAEMRSLSRHLAARALFSFNDEADVAAMGEALSGSLVTFGRTFHPLGRLLDLLPLPSTRRIRESMVALDAIVDGEIARRRSGAPASDDLLEFLRTLKFDDDGGKGFSDLEIRHEAIDLLIASHDTIALATAWTLAELAKAPGAQETARREAVAVLGGRRPGLADLMHFPLCRAAFMEGLRLHPPAWGFLREAKVDVVLQGYAIPKDSVLILAPYVTQRDARWFPAPSSFDLERWTEGARKARPPMAYYPFGGGPRECAGEGLAIGAGTVVIATLLRSHAFSPVATLEGRERALGFHAPGPIPVSVTRAA